MSQLEFSTVTLPYFTFVQVTVMDNYSKKQVIHIISIAVDWKHYQLTLGLLILAVLIKWPLENLQENYYIFISDGILSITVYWLCKIMICLSDKLVTP
jgi:hypothetical protein